MKWRRIIEVAKILPDDATVTQAECTATVEAARAICCLARTGSICFDLDGHLIEDCSSNKTRKRNKVKDDVEGTWKKEEEEISRLSHSLSSSVHVDISDSGSAEEMSQKHYKLGAKPKWSAHADWPNMSEESSATPIPPWRDKLLWRITTTKTVEGLMSEQPSRGVKQNFEGFYEALSRNHAMEYARLIKEYEEVARLPGKETNKENAAKDQELNRKFEEILSLMKDMAGKSNLSKSEPRYEEVLSFMKEIAGEAMKQKMKEDSEAVQEEVSYAGESSKKGEDDQGKMEQNVSTSQSEKRSEDRQGKEDFEFSGPPTSKKKHE